MSEAFDFALVFGFIAAAIAWISFERHNAHWRRPSSPTEGRSGNKPE